MNKLPSRHNQPLTPEEVEQAELSRIFDRLQEASARDDYEVEKQSHSARQDIVEGLNPAVFGHPEVKIASGLSSGFAVGGGHAAAYEWGLMNIKFGTTGFVVNFIRDPYTQVVTRVAQHITYDEQGEVKHVETFENHALISAVTITADQALDALRDL